VKSPLRKQRAFRFRAQFNRERLIQDRLRFEDFSPSGTLSHLKTIVLLAISY
jgi:hypothetical protein